MQAHEIETNGITVHVRVGGHGPAVVMLHGFRTTGDLWGPPPNALLENPTPCPAEFVTHDIGVMVGFAIAATHPERMSRWVAIDAPLPGVGPWEQITQNPAMWHFGFGGSDMERLVAGRERIYLDRFWNELSRDPKRFDEAKRQHYAALYAQPGAIRAGFAQF